MNKVALLFSTGLDSILAYYTLKNKGFEVIPVHFKTCFFGKSKKELKDYEELLKTDIKVFDITKDFIKVLKNPKFGYGKNLNPCLDCKILMFKKLKELFPPEKYILASGEVLGQRPFSQHKDAFSIIEREANLKRLIFRPLSAKLLPPTLYEEKGILKKEDFFDIKGRSRKKQEELIKFFNLDKEKLPQPAGGCLLTDPGFAKKVKIFLEKDILDKETCKFLKVGKVIDYKDLVCILSRNYEENLLLTSLKREKDLLIIPKFKGGRLLIIDGKNKKLDLETLKELSKFIIEKTRHAPQDALENFEKYFELV